MITIKYEVIVKYNSNVKSIESELDVFIEILSSSYAIVNTDKLEEIDKLTDFPEIEYVEKPFTLQTQDAQSFSSTGIESFKIETKLSGKDTLLGIIDSGIDYNLPVFKDKNGNSKILYYWDQAGTGTPPEGFQNGTLYTAQNINEAPVYITSSHGTHVAGICSSIANNAKLIVVKVGNSTTDTFSRSTEFMRALRFVLDKAVELNMPIAINISYGTNEGSHRGISLFEEFIDEMAVFWKNNIVVAAGNNARKGSHKRINLKENEEDVEFIVGENEKILNLNIWPSYVDKFDIYLINPSNKKTQILSKENTSFTSTISNTNISGIYFDIAPYSLSSRISFVLKSNNAITPGVWKVIFENNEIVEGIVDLYLPTSEGLSPDTKFLTPDEILTVTVPGTAKKVITVGSFNSRTDTRSIFSGEGDFSSGIYKPDILAPGEDILSFLPGGTIGALTGTSMATPHVTGVCALLMEWGIVNNNDPFLYSQKTRALLNENARRKDNIIYPNSSYGYGFLNLRDLSLENYLRNIYNFRNKSSLIDAKREVPRKLINAVLITYYTEFEDEVDDFNLDYDLIKLSDNRSILFLEEYSVENIAKIMDARNVATVEKVVRIAPLGEISMSTSNGINPQSEMGVEFFKNNPNIPLNGQNTIIAIIDTGIDYLHQDFIYSDGSSKIKYLWDQTKEGTPPEGFYIGSEYSNEKINEAIKNQDSSLSSDEEGHGTMISGICAGLGNINKEYEGVAPGADLIVVKLQKIGNQYNNAMLSVAIEYVYKKARELNIATVVNISMGNSVLAGYANIVNSESNYFSNGISTVAACGNEGNTEIHTSGSIKLGEEKVIEIQVEETESFLRIELWMVKHDRVNLEVITPSGETTKTLDTTNFEIISGIFDLENTEYTIRYKYPTVYSGQEHTVVYLKNATPGIWRLKLTGAYISNGEYDVYLENRIFLNKGTKFSESTPNYTINFPSVQQDLISVGTYDTNTNSVWASSSRGPSIIKRLKPDIIAPGVNIIAPYPNNKYATITGSAPAGANVSGIVSLLYEYIIAQKTYPNKGFVQMVRTYIHAGGRRGSNQYPNEIEGYGIINLRGMFDELL